MSRRGVLALLLGVSACAQGASPSDPLSAPAERGSNEGALEVGTASASASASASAPASPPTPPTSASAPLPAPPPAPPANAPLPLSRGRERGPGGEARIYAKTRFVWVYYQPSRSSGWLGFLWLGGSAELKSPKPIATGVGCDAWYEVKPAGYVCVDKDSDSVTLDPDDPTLKAMLPYAPKKDSPWPHQYGESTGVERYFKQPTVNEQRGREFLYDEHLRQVAEARGGGALHKSLQGIDLTPGSPDALTLPTLPRTMREQRTRLLPMSTVAWSRDFVDAEGRSWLLSADFAFVPKDRVITYPPSQFHGVKLEGDVKLPIAFFRERPRAQYTLDEAGVPQPNGQQWPRLAWVQLTGKRVEHKHAFYQETSDGLYVNEADAVIPTPQPATPWGAPVNGEDTTGRGPRGRKTWVEISILGGWMIAYEGTRPVYATMISPGRGGLPTRGVDPVETAATPVGTWVVTGKFVTATMVAPHEFIHSDVPWTQNFHGPHALHVAYWHDAWGEKKSAGCVNVSAIDGKWLFDWTDPQLPDGWHGIRWDKDLSPATQTVLHQLAWARGLGRPLLHPAFGACRRLVRLSAVGSPVGGRFTRLGLLPPLALRALGCACSAVFLRVRGSRGPSRTGAVRGL